MTTPPEDPALPGDDSATLARSPAARLAWLGAGWILFGVGVVGVVLPGLPTVGPMLMALACFARGSRRVHDWLWNHPTFGPPLRRWRETGTISRRSQATALLMMLGSLALVVWLTSLPTWGKGGIAALIGVGMIVVVRLPVDPT